MAAEKIGREFKLKLKDQIWIFFFWINTTKLFDE